MNLSKLKNLFASEVRYRGTEYFYSRKVKLLLGDNKPLSLFDLQKKNPRTFSSLDFEVYGSQNYEISLSVSSENLLICSCNCPYAEDFQYCKHIWASLQYCETHQIELKYSDDQKSISSEKSWLQKILKEQSKFNHENQNLRLYSSSKSENARSGFYIIDRSEMQYEKNIVLKLYIKETLKNGKLGTLKEAHLTQGKIKYYDSTEEQIFLKNLIGVGMSRGRYHSYSDDSTSKVVLELDVASSILSQLTKMGKLYIFEEKNGQYFSKINESNFIPYHFKDEFWFFELVLNKSNGSYYLCPRLKNSEGQFLDFNKYLDILGKYVFTQKHMCLTNLDQHVFWFNLTYPKPLEIHESEVDSFLEYYFNFNEAKPSINLPPDIKFEEKLDVVPRVQISVKADTSSKGLLAEIQFLYLDHKADWQDYSEEIYNLEDRYKLKRQVKFENEHRVHLENWLDELSIVDDYPIQLGQQQFVALSEKALNYGWSVIVQDQKLKLGEDFKFNIASGIDWFDLNGTFQFGDQWVSLPQLLRNLKSGKKIIELGDGSSGLLPTEWINRLQPLLDFNQLTDEGLRLSKVQMLYLESGGSVLENLISDRKFETFRNFIHDLNELKPIEADKKFKGQLRSYQKHGLSWLQIMTQNQLGGILADDMGLGKTIQILALLSKNVHQKDQEPSLVVCPKSLIFNWQAECQKFCPHISVAIYAGEDRQELLSTDKKIDLLIVTYQTLRIDIDYFIKKQFKYFIIDEAHSIKNSQTQISIAAKLIKARKKIALTGTPVENSIHDLFSILSAVTPGLVTESQADQWSSESKPERLQTISKALAPFILRRTKKQVLTDLPDKSEQILFCELSAKERRKYDDLKKYYWLQLSGKIEEKGLQKSKIEVLEAMLRLRQAACHQGLLDEKMNQSTSSKFDAVLEQLETLILENRKVLIFSQFTRLLKLFSQELVKRNWQFEYLDGKTVNRAQVVENFQTNPKCSLFLISLKAGGVGLNLTAAECVFILDPWWNPAAESQAIDRAHRIGQKNKVMAYKVIAKGTIEEKILDMQAKKKNLADAIVSGESSVLKLLKLEDLKELFGS